MKTTLLESLVDPAAFMIRAAKATTAADVNDLLDLLPIVSEQDFSFNKSNGEQGWQEGKFHWVPVGLDRGNAGRIKQANHPVNPIAERTVNGMEAIIELSRQRELALNSISAPPTSPRDAVKRYYQLPPLDELPKLDNSPESKAVRIAARNIARQLRVGLLFDKSSREFTVSIDDDGIGQQPDRIHQTLLSLGSTTKAEHWYLIGVFGQGGSSAFAVSNYSWVMSRRAADQLNGHSDGVGWTVVKHVFQKGRRDDYFAYLAAAPDGRVPFISQAAADEAGITHGTRFAHIGYNFGSGGSSITRQLFPAMNHVLYNPVLPYELQVGPTKAPMYGNGYRLSSAGKSQSTTAPALDKTFPQQLVGA